jgi:hypothetical protein
MASFNPIFFYPVDDLIEPSFLEDFYNKMKEGNDVVVGNYYGFRDGKLSVGKVNNPNPFGFGTPSSAMVFVKNIGNLMFSQKEDDVLYDKWEYEGCQSWARILLSGCKIGYVPKTLYTHVRSANSMGARLDWTNAREVGEKQFNHTFNKKKKDIILRNFNELCAKI